MADLRASLKDFRSSRPAGPLGMSSTPPTAPLRSPSDAIGRVLDPVSDGSRARHEATQIKRGTEKTRRMVTPSLLMGRWGAERPIMHNGR